MFNDIIWMVSSGQTSTRRLQIFQDADYIFPSFFPDLYGSLRCITCNDSFLCDANPRILREKVGRKEKRVTVSAVVAPCYTVDRKKKYESSLPRWNYHYPIFKSRYSVQFFAILELSNRVIRNRSHRSIKIFV